MKSEIGSSRKRSCRGARKGWLEEKVSGNVYHPIGLGTRPLAAASSRDDGHGGTDSVFTERARSLSPTKGTSSPNIGSPASARSKDEGSFMDTISRTPSLPQPRSHDRAIGDNLQKPDGARSKMEPVQNDGTSRPLPQPPSKPQTLSQVSPSTAVAPSRAGTLSWAQRPTLRGSATPLGPREPRSRPQSSLASENTPLQSPKAREDSVSSADDGKSRSQIAASLSSKDPSWFKQTHDRGAGSAAYRRNKDDEQYETSARKASIGLPGMSRESTAEPEKSPPTESVRSVSPATVASANGSFSGSTWTNSTLPSSNGSVRSAMPLTSSQRFEPSSPELSTTSVEEKVTSGRGYAMSPAQGRLSPERMDRPASPTKGLGGFVQSAMMKRSDSVSKRWSTQNTPGLRRGDSIASNRSGWEAPRVPFGGMPPLEEPKPARFSRENTPASTPSRPSSSQSISTVTTNQPENARSDIVRPLSGMRTATPPSSNQPKDESRPSSRDAQDEPVMSPPSSPSKRWSPQKSSWLENAINKPDSPKVMSPANTSQQPSWMAGIAKAKQQRGSVDLTRGPTHKQVTPGGLMRSGPPGVGYKPPNIGGLPATFSAGVSTRSRSGSSGEVTKPKHAPTPSTSSGFPSSKSLGNIPSRSLEPTNHSPIRNIPLVDEPQSLGEESQANTFPQTISQRPSSPGVKPKPETPPKKDFIQTLKPRPTAEQAPKKDEPEFKNVFGNLKRTQTQNYKAPDVLKDNILRGKAGLAATGGPKKSERRDELKESILQKKQGMAPLSASTTITSASSKNPQDTTPEALKKRQGLMKSENAPTSSPEVAPKSPEVSTPEALQRLQHLRDKPKPNPSEKPALGPATNQNKANAGLGGNFTSSLTGILQRGPSPMSTNAKPSKPPPPAISPRPTAPQSDETQAGPQLNHATKGRARGPKRKPPTSSQQNSPQDSQREFA